MRVFVTGASGFIGSAVVQDLLANGHQVLGMVRSESATEKLVSLGAKAHRGDLYDLESIKSGAVLCDAVIHTAFDHDFSKFKDNCETDRKVIDALAEALAGTAKPLVITSGVGALGKFDRLVTEDDLPKSGSDISPRMASEEAAHKAMEAGVDAYIMRLPPTVHGRGDHGFIPMIINITKQQGISAYIGEGLNRWPAVHRFDAATLYRLIIEQRPALKIHHAVAEEGVAFKEIATAIGEGLQAPVMSKTGDEVAAHFTWFTYFAGFDCATSSAKSRLTTGWQPKQTGLIEDMKTGGYFD
jgi:nucleoside-diphosphate-sugar epimerase